jgi:CRP-like cAMP-binding protein
MSINQEEFLKSGTPITFKKGELILRQGQVSHRVYFVVEGFVRHFVIDTDGNEKTIRLSPENQFFYSSNISYYYGESSYINCQTLEESKCLYWEKRDLDNLKANNFDFLKFENMKLIDFIVEKHRKEIDRITLTAKERLLKFNEESQWYFNRIPHHIIASYLDMTPETLSRLRANLKS